MAKKKRTEMRSKAGKLLYAVRDEKGEFTSGGEEEHHLSNKEIADKRRPKASEMSNYMYHAANHGRDSEDRPTQESTLKHIDESAGGGKHYSEQQKSDLTSHAQESWDYFHKRSLPEPTAEKS